jgi:hypothetical protein
MKESFNIQELLHPKFKYHGTKPLDPSLSRAFQRHQEHDLNNPGLLDSITTKQNKINYLPAWIDVTILHDAHTYKNTNICLVK